MVSGNDAAVALSEFVAGSINSFADMMNEKASNLGLKSTHFISPHGLDAEEHYTTAFELALITNYALENSTFRKIVNTKNYTVTIDDTSKLLNNTNELLGSLDGIYGVKTGFTNGANRCLVTACKRNDLDIICVVLGCDTKKDRTLDSIKLINYAFNNFSVINIKELISKNFVSWVKNNIDNFTVNKGLSSDLDLYLDFSKIPYEKIAINNSLDNPISTNFEVNYNYTAPVFIDNKVGSIAVSYNKNYLFSVEILTKNTISRKTVSFYLKTFIKYYFSYLEEQIYRAK